MRNAWLCSLLLLGSLGCPNPPPKTGEDNNEVRGACPEKSDDCVGVAKLPPLDEACPKDRLIGLRPSNEKACPQPEPSKQGRWATSLLFDRSDERTTGAALSTAMRSYCVYEWRPGIRNAAPDTEALLRSLPQVKNLAPDCQVMATLGSHGGDVTWKKVHQAFHTQVDAVRDLPTGAAPPQSVRVAVIDSSPDGSRNGLPLPGRSGHGLAVGTIIHELACPDPARAAAMPDQELSCQNRCGASSPNGQCWCDEGCAFRDDCCVDIDRSCSKSKSACIADVNTYLALPHITRTAVDYKTGGFFGTQTELALAIHRAVSDWLAQHQEQHLVINLSLGWDPRYGGLPKGDTNVRAQLAAPVAAIHAELTRAACLGAIVVAAAGNDSGGSPPPTGPMLPAAWETQKAPSADDCKEFLTGAEMLATPKKPTNSGYRPFLYSAGGLARDDAALAIGRVAGRPRLAAPADHGVATRFDTDVHGAPTDVLTGTSVSSAVVAAIATTVWGYRPSLSAAEVMELVYGSAVGLSQPADYCAGGLSCPLAATDPAREIRRVSLCRAVRTACNSAVELCPPASQLPKCTGRAPFVDAGPRIAAADFTALGAPAIATVDASSVIVPLAPVAVCGPPRHFNREPSYPLITCPERQFHRAPVMPWTTPQPGSDPCPTCWIKIRSAGPSNASAFTAPAGPYVGTIYISIDSGFSAPLKNPTLLVPGVGELSLPDLGVLPPGSVVVVDGIAMPTAPSPGAVLSFAALDAAGTVTNSTASVLVEQLE